MTTPVLIAMGSKSDWETMQHASDTLKELGIHHVSEVISAHRTPDKLFEMSKNARAQDFKIIIAGAGGSAHLPGMMASLTSLPVIGVPIKSKTLNGIDSLLSIVQMPKGVSVATMSIGKAGAINGALMAASILSLEDSIILAALEEYRANQTLQVLEDSNLD